MYWQVIPRYIQKIDLRTAIKTGIAAGCSFYIAKSYSHLLDRPDAFASGLWCVVTTIIVMQANIGSTYKAGVMRISGIVIGSLMGGAFSAQFGTDFFTLAVAVAASNILCMLFLFKEASRIAGLTVAVVMISSMANSQMSPWAFSLFRSLDAFIGILVAIVISHLVWPEQTWLHIQNQFFKAVQQAKKCFHETVKKFAQPKTPSTEIEELFNRLIQLHSELNDAKLTFAPDERDMENWLSAVQGLDAIAESIAIIQSIPKSNLMVIFDESLKIQVDNFIDATDEAFSDLLSLCVDNTPVKLTEKINPIEQTLWDDLERFRNTHTTRNFALADVENFYTFFYNLRFISRQLRFLQEHLQSFYA